MLVEAAQIKNEDKDLSSDEKSAASFLRERFLYLIASLSGKACEAGMKDGTKVTGQIRGFDLPFGNMLLQNVAIPTSQGSATPMRILRTQDILTISCKDNI